MANNNKLGSDDFVVLGDLLDREEQKAAAQAEQDRAARNPGSAPKSASARTPGRGASTSEQRTAALMDALRQDSTPKHAAAPAESHAGNAPDPHRPSRLCQKASPSVKRIPALPLPSGHSAAPHPAADLRLPARPLLTSRRQRLPKSSRRPLPASRNVLPAQRRMLPPPKSPAKCRPSARGETAIRRRRAATSRPLPDRSRPASPVRAAPNSRHVAKCPLPAAHRAPPVRPAPSVPAAPRSASPCREPAAAPPPSRDGCSRKARSPSKKPAPPRI